MRRLYPGYAKVLRRMKHVNNFMKQTPSYPPRRNLRVPDFDYSQPGAYYVTIVTHERKQLFGQIVDGAVVLNEVGKMVKDIWIAIPKHFPNVELDKFVIMPNHIHGIISITAGAQHAVPAQDETVVKATHAFASTEGVQRSHARLDRCNYWIL